MRKEEKKGFTYSGVLHIVVLLMLIVGLPSLFELNRDIEPAAITVEILPITSITNVKPSEEKPKPKEAKKEEKKEEPKKPTPPVITKKPLPPPEPQVAEKKPEEKKPEEKKPEPKKEEKKPEESEDDLLAVLKSVKETAEKKKTDQKDEKDTASESKSKSQKYDPTIPLSLSERDAIRSQISQCWSVPAGAKDAHELIIVLRVQVERDGSVMNVGLADSTRRRYGSDSFFRAAADSAMRAVRMCSPLKNLPAEKFNTWRDMELTFDPKEMLF